MTLIINHPRDLFGKEGTVLGPSDWIDIDQQRIDGFAEVTGDHQWIHVDPVRAKDGPFGTTIAHGFLTMSLVNLAIPQMIDVLGFTHAVNIGADRLRFLSPVPVGSRIRATGEIISVEEKPDGGIQLVVRVTMESEGGEKPACVIDSISRYYCEDAA